MATRQLLSVRSFIPDSLGNPARGAYVHILEPGTTTRVTSYKDGNLQNANTNPVALSAAGKASIWVSRDVDVRITLGPNLTDPILASEPNANPDQVGATSSGLVPNGSFETDADANNVPDGWTLASNVGANNSLDTTVSSDGQRSFRFTSAGTGGGSLITTDFFAVNATDQLRVNFDIRSSVAGVRNIVRVEWFDVSQVPISNTDVYDNSTTNPTVFTPQSTTATPPANARFAKLRLIGCDPSDTTPGSTWFDRINVFYPLVVSGVFNNLTISGNQIISTNTNGAIFLRPNGTGAVGIGSTGAVDLTDALNPLNIGETAAVTGAPHLAFDASRIQAKATDTTAATLQLNPFGGTITSGANLVDMIRADDIAAAYRLRNSIGGADMYLANVSGQLSLRQLTAAGVLEDEWITMARNGAVGLRHNNVERIATTASGSTTTGTLAELVNAGAVEVANSSRNSAGGIRLRVATDGSARVDQLSGAGANEQTWLFFGRNGNVGLNHNNVRRFDTTANGYTATGSIFANVNASNTLTEYEIRNSTGGIQLGVQVGGGVQISQTNSAGVVEDIWLDLTRNGQVELRHNNIGTARTATSAAGGLEVNNTSTGAGFERVLTTSDLVAAATPLNQIRRKDTATNRTNDATFTADPDLTGFVLAANQTYTIEAALEVDPIAGGSTPGFRARLDLTGGATLATNNFLSFIFRNGAGTTVSSDTSAPTAGLTFDVAVADNIMWMRGLIRTNAAGNMSLAWGQANASANATGLNAGSWMRVTNTTLGSTGTSATHL